MKIIDVQINRRRREFLITAGGKAYPFPFAKLRLVPTTKNPVTTAFPDPELGCEAFTYRLKSGDEDSLHLDAVLEINSDPDLLQHMFMHKLAIEASRALKESGIGIRQAARMLGTSPTQVYRLLDSTVPGKPVGQLLALLALLDREVELNVRRAG